MNDDENAGVSRRDVLEQTGVAATAIAGVGTAPAVAALGERKTTITTLAQRDEARGTERVSKRWLQQTKRATRVKEQLMNAHGNSEGIRSIGIVSDDRTIGDLRAEAVSVEVTDPVHAQSIPSSVDGVSVVTEVVDSSDTVDESTVSTECTDQYCSSTLDKLTGGTSFETDFFNATMGCRCVYNGNYHMLAARHLFINESDAGYCTESMDDSTWERNDETFGPVSAEFQQKDTALLRLNNDHSDIEYSNEILAESGNVVGRVTGSGLSYLNGKKSETVYKQGRATGSESGYVTEIKGEEECGLYWNNILQTVISTTDQKKGDSGGVVYFKEEQSSSPDHLYTVHIATIQTGSGNAKGSSANKLYNDHGIWFGGEPYSGE